MVRRTKDEAEQTRSAILDAAEQVFFNRGVVRTSLQEIAVAARVTRGAVYWHFKNKLEIMQALVDRVVLPQEHLLEQLEANDSNTPLTDLNHVCQESLAQMFHDQQRRRIFTILNQRCEYVEELSGIMKTRYELRERILSRFTRLFERAQKQKQLAPIWTPRTAAMVLHGLMYGLLLCIVLDCPEASAACEKNHTTCVATFFKALSA